MSKLWYQTPATVFERALPIGNGRLGGMIYADPNRDHISLNEDTLWTGFPKDKSPDDPYTGVQEAKDLLRQGKVGLAEDTLWRKSLGKWVEWYQSAGQLRLEQVQEVPYTDFHRELDLNTGVASSDYVQNGQKIHREVFSSHNDQVLVYRFQAEKSPVSMRIFLDIPHPSQVIGQNDLLLVKAILPVSIQEPRGAETEPIITYDSLEKSRGITYAIGIRFFLNQGTCVLRDGIAELDSSDFYLLLDIASNFESFDRHPIDSIIDPLEVCRQRLEAAGKIPFQTLKASHIRDYQELFSRVQFHLDGIHRDDLPTDLRLRHYSTDASDVGMAELLFDYGRYLTIAGSRPGTQPTNLQGIWNEQITPPWHADYTLNINTEMNYWHVEAANLSDCHLPLLEMIAQMRYHGMETAQRNYHCSGWCAHHNTDIWRTTEPVGGESSSPDACVYGFWNMSAAWLSTHIWQHYRYTLDRDFLDRYWPVMRDAAVFLLDWMEPDADGFLTTPLATSPENYYLLDDGPHSISQGSAMDLGIIRELFRQCTEASRILYRDADFRNKLESALAKLRPFGVDAGGMIEEWNEPRLELEPQHRHISLLYGLYPGHSIHAQTPELLRAAETVLRRRGYEATGWALGWRICAWARLGNGEEAKKFVDQMLRCCEPDATLKMGGGGGVYENLLVAHPPFQIDGNFAFVAGIIEMLIQVHGKEPVLLPALPEAWSHGGYLHGIRIPGRQCLDLDWANGSVTHQHTYSI